MTIREHELRRSVVAEMHLRRWPALKPPMVVVQVLRLVADDEREEEAKALSALPDGALQIASANPRHRHGQLPGGID